MRVSDIKTPLNVVVGMGKTGDACVRYLLSQGEPVAVVDSRDAPPTLGTFQKNFPDVLLQTGDDAKSLIDRATRLIVSPGVSLQHPLLAEAIAAGVEIVGDVELFARANKAPIIAVTGSNGKTTVTTLLGEMCKAAGKKTIVCGNIGVPVLEVLSEAAPDYYVMELSSFQLETTQSLNACAAVILNISADHMDRYDNDINAYRLAKQRIYLGCKHAVVNKDEPENGSSLPTIQDPIAFTLLAPSKNEFGIVQKNQQTFLAYGDRVLLDVVEMPLSAPHHWQNALAALAVGHAVGLPFEPMIQVLKKFTGLAHRCEKVSQHNNVVWYNDSKATNVGASIAAIVSVGSQKKGQLILIAGGDAKQADITPMINSVKTYVDHAVLLGQDAGLFEAAFQDVVPVSNVTSLERAVQRAAELAKPGDAVLLSPACASFDMFDNFEHRGRVFAEAIQEMIGKIAGKG